MLSGLCDEIGAQLRLMGDDVGPFKIGVHKVEVP